MKLISALDERFTEEITRSRARHLERVGDQARNIAEDADFAASAEDIRRLHAS